MTLTASLTRPAPARPAALPATRPLAPPRAPVPAAPRAPARASVAVAAAAAPYGATPPTDPDAYVVLGLAHVFRQGDGGLSPAVIVEPVSANSLECMAAGGATSYSEVAAVRARAALDRSFAAALPPAWASAPLCDEWEARLGACARTWARPHAADALMDLVPLGSVKSGWNFTPDGGAHKRVLGAAVEVSDEDNVKQDISIDVYGRGDHADAVDGGLPVVKDDADADGAPAVAPVTVGKVKVAKVGAKAAAADDDDDDLDALLGL